MKTINKAPTVIGSKSKAWQMDLAEVRKVAANPNPNDSAVGAWLIEAPWAHPLWHSYILILIHLRPLPNPPASTAIFLDGATHELMLYALHPDTDREKYLKDASPQMIDGSMGMPWLSPANFGAQIAEDSDARAISRVENVVRKVCDGSISPDTDYIRQWINLFGDNMIRGNPKTAGETKIIGDGFEIVIPAKPRPQDLH